MLTDKQKELIELLKGTLPTAPAEIAQNNVDWYKPWRSGETLAVGDRRAYEGVLYEVIQAHTTQDDWTPDVVPALWAVLNADHQGTLTDPIPASRGMEYEYGKYYSEGDNIYLCERTGEAVGGKIVLQYLPSELVGQYFSVV